MYKNTVANKQILASILRSTLVEKGISQRSMASKLSRSQTYIFRVLNGQQSVFVEDFLNWCNALGLDWKEVILKLEQTTQS